jgi:uncharacterized protein (TIRG00374 family)
VIRKLKMPISLALAGLFIYWFLNKLDWRQVWADVRGAKPDCLSLALVLLLGTYLVRSLRWRRLLQPMASPSLRGLLRATMVGFAALFFVGRAGEMIVRPAALSEREPVERSASYASVMIERVFDMVMVDLFFAVNLVFFEFNGRDVESVRRFGLIRTAGFLLLGVAVAGIYGLSVFRRKRQGVLSFLERKLVFLPKRFSAGLLDLLKHISEGLAVLHDVRGLAVTVAYTVLLWSMVVGAYLLVLRAFDISGSQVSVTGAVFVMGLSMLGSAVPAPGGSTGPFHAATAAALIFLGVDRNKAASAAIVLHLLIFLPAVGFGLFFLLKEGLSFSSLMRRGEGSKQQPGPKVARPATLASPESRSKPKALAAKAAYPMTKRASVIVENKIAAADILQSQPGEEERV